MQWTQRKSSSFLGVAHILLLTLTILDGVASAPAPGANASTRHSHQHRLRHHHHQGQPSLDEHFNPALGSSRVAFSADKPLSPPDSDISAGDFDPEDEALLRSIAGGNEGVGGRAKRNVDPKVRPVCETESKWVLKTTAEDMHGYTYTVMQEIEVNGVIINQFFYETTCKSYSSSVAAGTPRACTGIDPLRFTSMCMETFTFVYAEVMAADGSTGWTLIKNPASCNCGVLEREPMGLIDFS